MRRWLTLFFGLAVACSYSLDLPVCKVTCQSQADCPADSTCRSGFCQKGSVDQCAVSTGGSSPDAASTGGVTGTG